MRNYIYQICILKCIIPDFPINDELTQCENPKKIRFRCTRHNNISYMLEYINNININVLKWKSYISYRHNG